MKLKDIKKFEYKTPKLYRKYISYIKSNNKADIKKAKTLYAIMKIFAVYHIYDPELFISISREDYEEVVDDLLLDCYKLVVNKKGIAYNVDLTYNESYLPAYYLSEQTKLNGVYKDGALISFVLPAVYTLKEILHIPERYNFTDTK